MREMKVTSISDAEPAPWDEQAVAVGGGFFHSHAETVYRAAGSNCRPVFLRIADDAGDILAVATGAIDRSRTWPFSRFCSYAMLSGLPATRGRTRETQTLVMRAVEAHLHSLGVFSVKVDSFDSPGSEDVLVGLGYRLEERREFIVDLTPSVEDIWRKFKGSRRTDVRKAEKNGVETRIESDEHGLELVLTFAGDSMRRRGKRARQTDESVMQGHLDRIKNGHIDVFASYRQGRPINASLFGFFNGRAYYHISGSSDEGNKYCGPSHLLWTAMKHYKERGAVLMNLGAATVGQENLGRFKQAFGAVPSSAPIGVKRISRMGCLLHWLRSMRSSTRHKAARGAVDMARQKGTT